MSCYEQFQVLLSPKRILCVPPRFPSGARDPQPGLLINRANGAVSLPADPQALAAEMTQRGQGSAPSAPSHVHKMSAYGVLGVASAPHRGPGFLVLARRRVRVGEVRGAAVWRLDEAEIVPIRPTGAKSHEEELVKSFLVQVLSTPYFYFSYNYDLSHTVQRLFNLNGDAFLQRPLLQRADSRFVWNLHLLSSLVDGTKSDANAAAVYPFLLPLVHGVMMIERCEVGGRAFTWSILSRRSRFRVGTRFFVRGADPHGHVGNFVETEQLVEQPGGAVASFVQTRGSMPMYWQQYPNIKYKPKPTMVEGDSLAAFMAHFKQQLPLYGEQVIVNLVNQKGSEGEMELNLKNLVKEAGLRGVHYEAFDFHAECKGMRYDKLSKLVDRLKPNLRDYGYFFLSGDGGESSVMTQRGVFRTNCMDCLDRTNVVQSLLAAENLQAVLTRMGVVKPEEDVFASDKFTTTYRNVWADHANLISVQYAGTGALKTDFTRTGKRSRWGLLQDGWNSLNRYYLNNFADGDRTDANRFFVGETSGEDFFRSRASRDRERKEKPLPTLVAKLPLLLTIALSALVFALVVAPFSDGRLVALVALCLVSSVLLFQLVLQHGYEFVNKPVTDARVPAIRHGF